MRCLRAILGVSRKERKTNEFIRKSLDLKETIVDIIRTKRLKWFGHVVRRDEESYVIRAYQEDFARSRPTGRPSKRWSNHISEDLGIPLATASRAAQKRKEWGKCSHRERARALTGLST